MAARVLVCALLLAGCGRFGFGAHVDDDTADARGGDAPGNGQGDAALLDCTMTHPGALFCDGFEGTPMAGWDYAVVQFGTVQPTTARAYRGTTSLAITTDSSGNTKYARWGHFFPAAITSGDLYYRAFYWLTSGTVITDQLSILVTGNGQPPYPSSFVLLAPGMIYVQPNGGSFGFAGDLPRDRWVCLEMHVFIDPTNGYEEVSLDGQPSLKSPTTDTAVTGGYTQVEIGVHYATPAQDAALLWADEVVVDTSPIGCN